MLPCSLTRFFFTEKRLVPVEPARSPFMFRGPTRTEMRNIVWEFVVLQYGRQ